MSDVDPTGLTSNPTASRPARPQLAASPAPQLSSTTGSDEATAADREERREAILGRVGKDFW